MTNAAKKMSKKTIAIAASVLVVLLAAAIVLAIVLKPATVEGAKHINLKIVFSDDNTKEIGIDTDAEYLRQAVESKIEIAGDESEYGLFVKTVDGVTADESQQQWWCITKGGEQVNTGIDTTPIADGDSFELTLTTGW